MNVSNAMYGLFGAAVLAFLIGEFSTRNGYWLFLGLRLTLAYQKWMAQSAWLSSSLSGGSLSPS